MYWLTLFAEGEAPPDGLGALLRGPMLPMLIVMVFLFIWMGRSSARQRREQAEMLARLKKNDKVVTSSGIIGHVVQIKDDQQQVLIKSEDSRFWVLKSVIAQVLEESAVVPGDNKPS